MLFRGTSERFAMSLGPVWCETNTYKPWVQFVLRGTSPLRVSKVTVMNNAAIIVNIIDKIHLLYIRGKTRILISRILPVIHERRQLKRITA